MKTDSTKPSADAAEGNIFLGENWFDPLEEGVRSRIRGFIEELLEAELDAALARKRYERPSPAGSSTPLKASSGAGRRHGHLGADYCRLSIGRQGLMSVYRMGRRLNEKQRRQLGFLRKMPCHATLTETIRAVDVDALAA